MTKNNKKFLIFRYNVALSLIKLREQSGLSLEELSGETQISTTTLRNFEMGRIDHLGEIIRLANYYGKTPKLIFT